MAEELASFVASRTFSDLSDTTVLQLKIRILDSLGCAIGALEAPPIKTLHEIQMQFGGAPHCTLIASDKSSPDQATFYNGALVRYLDFNDAFLAKEETCHPSDNFAPILAAGEFCGASGQDLLLAFAVAYQVQCRLSEVAPVRAKGFDHISQGTFAVSAGASKALELDPIRTAHAIAISGTALNALRVSRTGKLSNWKGLAYPFMAASAIKATFLAKDGVTGPLEVFEGNKGFMEAISGPFRIEWHGELLDIVSRTILKNYNAEIHSQSAIACALKLLNRISVNDIESLEVKIFDVAYNIIGGGEEGEKKESIHTKEQADHSLPYIIAVALLDGKVMPEQYEEKRINSDDVQILLRKIHVSPDKGFSARFPQAMPCEITVHTKSGTTVVENSVDYPGFTSHPFSLHDANEKFESLALRYASKDVVTQIESTVANLEELEVENLTTLLQKSKFERPQQRAAVHSY